MAWFDCSRISLANLSRSIPGTFIEVGRLYLEGAVASLEKVPSVRSRCHTKRSAGMTPSFDITLTLKIFFKFIFTFFLSLLLGERKNLKKSVSYQKKDSGL